MSDLPIQATDALLLDLLSQAQIQPIGLLLRTNDAGRLRARLYALRAQSGLGEDLQFRISTFPDGDLVIVQAELPQMGPSAPSWAKDLQL